MIKTINKKILIRIEKNFIRAKLRTVVWETATQIALRNYFGELRFSAQFYSVAMVPGKGA